MPWAVTTAAWSPLDVNKALLLLLLVAGSLLPLVLVEKWIQLSEEVLGFRFLPRETAEWNQHDAARQGLVTTEVAVVLDLCLCC